MASGQLWSNIQRKLQQVKSDMERLDNSDPSPGLHGQINVSLNSIKKGIDELEDFAKREITTAKREKGLDRVHQARKEYSISKRCYDVHKQNHQTMMIQKEREALLERRTSSTVKASTPSAPPNNNPDSVLFQMEHMMKEQTSLQNSEGRIDEFITLGRNALHELGDQRSLLKNAQRRLLTMANSLGMSATLIKYIERRSTQDTYILFGGIIITLGLMWAIVHYLT